MRYPPLCQSIIVLYSFHCSFIACIYFFALYRIHCHARLLLYKHKLLLPTLTQSIPPFFTLLLLCEKIIMIYTFFLYQITKYLTHYLYISV